MFSIIISNARNLYLQTVLKIQDLKQFQSVFVMKMLNILDC